MKGCKPKDNGRFVVTNLRASPRYLYKKVYCDRGDVENRIKELHHGLEIDRTSCTSFLANQLRVLLTAAAYVLWQELRLRAHVGEFATAQVGTLREKLLKLGVWVDGSVRRIVMHLPDSFPCLDEWLRIARSVGAVPLSQHRPDIASWESPSVGEQPPRPETPCVVTKQHLRDIFATSHRCFVPKVTPASF